MPKQYIVSADTSEKEKVVGGIFTIAQGLWLALGVVISCAVFLLLGQFIPPAVALILALMPGAAVGLLFALYKKYDIPLATYLMYKHRFNKKSKRIGNTASSNYDKQIPL